MFEIFSGPTRKRLYALLAVAGVIVGALQTAYLTLGYQPRWLLVALAVFPFVSGAIHSMSAGNTPPLPSNDPPAAAPVQIFPSAIVTPTSPAAIITPPVPAAAVAPTAPPPAA